MSDSSYDEISNSYSELYEHVKSRTKMYRELVLFIIFVSLLVVIIFTHRDVFNTHLMNTALDGAFVQNDFSFEDINKWSQIDDYFNGLLAPVLTSAQSHNYEVMHYNRLIGGIRLRQLRVRNDSCNLSSDFKKIFGYCYAQDYSGGTKATKPFGPPSDPIKYTYENGQKSGSVDIWGQEGGLYDAGGYITDLSMDSDFTNEFLVLQNDSWWDDSTRAIIVTLPFANANLNNRVTLLYLIFELNAAGGIHTYHMSRSFRFNLYITTADRVRFGLEIVFGVLIIYFIFVEIAEIYTNWRTNRSLWKYFTTLWNYVEVANLVVLVACVIMYLRYLRLATVDLASNQYIPQLERMGELFQNICNLSSINVLLSAFNIFKYLTLNTRLYLLWYTLGSAGTDLVYFLFIFLVVFFGFVMMAHLTFGADIAVFSSFLEAVGSCWQFIIGNPPSFDSLFSTNRVLGPIFYSLFTVFIFFVLVNMFIAIVTNAFTEQHDRARILKQATTLTQTLWSSVMAIQEAMKGNRPVSDLHFLRNLEDKDVLDLPVLTTEDGARAIGESATLLQIERLKALHLRFRHFQRVEQGDMPGEIPVTPANANLSSSELTEPPGTPSL